MISIDWFWITTVWDRLSSLISNLLVWFWISTLTWKPLYRPTQNQRIHYGQSQWTQTIQRTNQNSEYGKARENVCGRVTISFGIYRLSDWPSSLIGKLLVWFWFHLTHIGHWRTVAKNISHLHRALTWLSPVEGFVSVRCLLDQKIRQKGKTGGLGF